LKEKTTSSVICTAEGRFVELAKSRAAGRALRHGRMVYINKKDHLAVIWRVLRARFVELAKSRAAGNSRPRLISTNLLLHQNEVAHMEFTEEVIGRVGAKLEVWKGLRRYNTHGHKLRFPLSKKAQFVTECGIAGKIMSIPSELSRQKEMIARTLSPGDPHLIFFPTAACLRKMDHPF
jgi:hypothetical protein